MACTASLRLTPARPAGLSAPARRAAPLRVARGVVTRAGNIVETAVAAGNFKTLVTALTAAGALGP
jgi:hypothetical protein